MYTLTTVRKGEEIQHIFPSFTANQRLNILLALIFIMAGLNVTGNCLFKGESANLPPVIAS